MRLLLISNSTMAGEAYLGWPQDYIKEFLKGETKEVLFIPYAGVNLSDKGLQASFDAYEKRVAEVYNKLGYQIKSIHKCENPVEAVEKAEAVAVGGGNTFYLFHMMHKTGIMEAIAQRVKNGMPYMGWSAGSNAACPTLRTTNDMPIFEPASFNGLNVIPFQINPHYLDAHPEGHGGETREQRINEFTAVNQDVVVVGLREACLLQMEGDKMELKGKHPMRIFQHGKEAWEVQPGDDLSFLF
jgi:dipeptidase E